MINLEAFSSANTHRAHASRNIFQRQSHRTTMQQPLRGVWQDKGMPKFARDASKQPDPRKINHREVPLNTESDRVQKSITATFRTVKATTWLHPLIKAELERKAALTGLSLSKVMASLLEEKVQQDIHRQHDALLYPLLRQIIREELRTFSNRIVFFLMRIAFAAEQSRILITNILDRVLRREGVPEQTFTTLVDQSNRMARRNITQKTPQIQSLLEEWEATFAHRQEEEPGNTRADGSCQKQLYQTGRTGKSKSKSNHPVYPAPQRERRGTHYPDTVWSATVLSADMKPTG